jgi:NAD+ kinase
MGDPARKRISFEVPEDSDEDTNAVEVTFDPANPYRRKSSLVASEAVMPRPRQGSVPSECIVHQFLEAQRRACPSGAINNDVPIPHPAYGDPGKSAQRIDISDDMGHNALVEPKMRRLSKAIIDLDSLENHEPGQADQQAWTKEMTKSMSDLDLSTHDEIRSRTLTKKQLSDMAWGVRELSRRLSSMRIKFRVKTIFLLTKIHDEDLPPKTRELTKWLLDKDRETKYTVFVQDTLKDSKRFNAAGLVDELTASYASDGAMSEESARESVTKRLRYWNEDMCRSRPHMFDFVITLGGDGTVLYTSWLFQRIVPPILSFSLGSLGFLTKFDFNDYQSTLNTAFNEGVTVSLRLRFECTVMRSLARKTAIKHDESGSEQDNAPPRRDLVEELVGEEKEDAHTHRSDGTYEILNEVVVDRGPNPSKCTQLQHCHVCEC